MKMKGAVSLSTTVKVPDDIYDTGPFFCENIEPACLRFYHESCFDKPCDMEEEMASLMSGECTQLRVRHAAIRERFDHGKAHRIRQRLDDG